MHGGRAEGSPFYPTAKAEALGVIVSCGPLDIRQPAGLLLTHPVLEPFPGGEHPFKLSQKLLQVVLQNPVKGDQVAVQIVNDFILASIGLSFYQFADVVGTQISFFRITFNINNPSAIVWLFWLIWFYFMLRYYQFFKEIPEKGIGSSYELKRNSLLANMAISQLNKGIDDVHELHNYHFKEKIGSHYHLEIKEWNKDSVSKSPANAEKSDVSITKNKGNHTLFTSRLSCHN
jgi:hypothetical protein